MPKIRICKEAGCKNAQTTTGFCRLHYLKNWKEMQTEKKKRAAKNLNSYVESVLKKHPDRYIEIIKKDLRSKKFDQFVEDAFGGEEKEGVFDERSYDEEFDKILDELKIERDF